MKNNNGRFIGIRHRVKTKKEGDKVIEARPTQVAIIDADKVVTYDLATEDDELDFVLGRFPTAHRAPEDGEDLKAIQLRHLKTRRLKKEEIAGELPQNLLVTVDGEKHLVTKVPAAFDGLKKDDAVGMALGGSGDVLAFALSLKGEPMNATVLRLPPAKLKELRGDADKDDDATLLANLVKERPGLFQETTARDRDLIDIRECFRRRTDAMKERIACDQRLKQVAIGKVFTRSDGIYPEGGVEKQYDEMKANDKILEALEKEEAQRLRDLEKALERYDAYGKIFGPIKGVGPAIGARLISAIGDVRRFGVEANQEKIEELRAQSEKLEAEANFAEDLDKVQEHLGEGTIQTKYRQVQLVRSWKQRNGKEAEAALLDRALELYEKRKDLRKKARKEDGARKLKAFCGVHVFQGGKHEGVPHEKQFVRRRAGMLANYHPDARQALFLLGDQFNRRPDSFWGAKLIENKKHLRAKHPEVVVNEAGKKRYTDGHIQKMALWRTLSQFVVWLYRTWTKLEDEARKMPKPKIVGGGSEAAPKAEAPKVKKTRSKKKAEQKNAA